MRSERLVRVLGMVEEAGQVTVEQVTDRLQVSAATARRDLNALAERRLVLRTHGGAAAARRGYEVPLGAGSGVRARAERAMARAAVAQVGVGDVVGVNGGPATAEVARQLASTDRLAPPGGPGLTVVTNAVDIAYALCARPHVRLVLTGGTVLPRSYELAGGAARRGIEPLVLDVAVLGAHGVSDRFGVTASGTDEADVARALAAAARRVVVVAGAATLQVDAPARLLGLAGVDVLVTDTTPDARLRDGLDRAGVRVVVAG
ncbi:DeoR/GlpR family DNA-binding transcription regulator [Aquipuribacter sp. MA13-6]|uniref:DeoR/GlpR family DNA-binding transcription regulator n=1 Tax=unclassified Aquipuribacter TaxID=2635084 RepID=UPI003EE9FE9E